jgi:hypothetical protein
MLEEIRERAYGAAKGRLGLPRGALRTLSVPIRGLVSLIVDRVDHFQGTYRASVAGCQDVWRLDRHICWKRSSQWCVDILGEVTLA